MKISVITPTFNRAAQLPGCLDSVLGQTLRPCEHLIMDNLSADATPQVVADYQRRAPYPVAHVREADQGMYQAMNRARGRAAGEALFVLNDDDEFHDPGVLRLMADCLTRTGTDIVYGDVVLCDRNSGARRYRRHNQVNRLTLVHKAVCQQAILYRASALKTCGDFDEQYRIVGDYEWLLRAFFQHHLTATYLRAPIALCWLGGLSNAPEADPKHQAERAVAVQRWFTPREIKLAEAYRCWMRKLPFGTIVLDLFHPLKLNIKTMCYCYHKFVPDPRALLGY